MSLLRLISLWCLFVLLLSCGGAGDPAAEETAKPVEIYDVRGEVVRLIADDQIAVIKHEDIEGWMKAMTMEFPVKDVSDFEKLKEGATITAKVHVQDLDYWLADIMIVE